MWIGLVLFCLARLAEGAYDVEVYFVVDKEAEDVYTASDISRDTMEEEINYLISEITSYFETLKLGIKMYKRGLLFAGENLAPNSDAGTILGGFKSWLISNQKYEELEYDLAILLTGHDLTAVQKGQKSNSVAGLAEFERVCQQGVGIVEMRKEYNTASTLAHEIAHIMGADHDGEQSGYLMANTTGPQSQHRWTFSEHSRDMINNHLKRLIETENCFKKKSPESKHLTGVKLPTSLTNPNKICKRSHGNEAYMCGNNNNQGGDAVCARFYCSVNMDPSCPAVLPYDGMTCGNQMSCKKGKCVPDSDAPATQDGCPWGDVEFVHLGGGQRETCETIMSDYGPQNCAHMASECCKTCSDIDQGSDNNGSGSDSGNGGSGKCEDSRAIITLTTSTGEQTGTCSSLVTPETKLQCNSLAQICCASCQKYESSDPSCKYGDKSPQCSENQPSIICRGNEAVCCETCRNYKRELLPDDEVVPLILNDSEDPSNITMQEIPVNVFSTD